MDFFVFCFFLCVIIYKLKYQQWLSHSLVFLQLLLILSPLFSNIYIIILMTFDGYISSKWFFFAYIFDLSFSVTSKWVSFMEFFLQNRKKCKSRKMCSKSLLTSLSWSGFERLVCFTGFSVENENGSFSEIKKKKFFLLRTLFFPSN